MMLKDNKLKIELEINKIGDRINIIYKSISS